MLTAQRKQLLLERLRRDGRIVAKDLSVELDLSEDTIRRDLRELASEGLLQRVHGGALPASPTVANLATRRGMATDEKRRLGAKAAGLITGSQRIFIDGGTTNLELVASLPLDLAVTVITHSPAIAAALEPHHAIEVIVIGGKLFRHSMVTVGAAALEAIARLHIDVCFIGVTGLHRQRARQQGISRKRRQARRHRAVCGNGLACDVGEDQRSRLQRLRDRRPGRVIVPREAQSDGFANLDPRLIRA